MLVKDDDIIIREAHLFSAVKRWAVEECKRKEIDSTNGANLRQVSVKRADFLLKPKLVYSL